MKYPGVSDPIRVNIIPLDPKKIPVFGDVIEDLPVHTYMSCRDSLGRLDLESKEELLGK